MASRTLDPWEMEVFYNALLRRYGPGSLLLKTKEEFQVCRKLLLALRMNGIYDSYADDISTITLGIQLLTILANLAEKPVLEEAWVGQDDSSSPPSDRPLHHFLESLRRFLPNRQSAQRLHCQVTLSLDVLLEILSHAGHGNAIRGMFIQEVLEELCEVCRVLRSRLTDFILY